MAGEAEASGGDEVVSIQLVAGCIIVVVVFVAIMERIVEHLLHLAKRNKKYKEMLVKTIGGNTHTVRRSHLLLTYTPVELMVVGLIYLLVKFVLYVGGLSSLHYHAIDAADILVFLVVIFLVLQAVVIFVVLTYTNDLTDLVDLYSMSELVSLADAEAARPLSWLLLPKARRGMQLKLLEALFVKVYELPPLFSFPKYILEIQEDQVVQLVDLRISHWIILVGLFLVFFTCTGEMQTSHAPYRVVDGSSSSAVATRQDTRVLVMGILAGSLLCCMLLLMLALHRARLFLLRRAGQFLAIHQNSLGDFTPLQSRDDEVNEPQHLQLSVDAQIRQMRAVRDIVRSREPSKHRQIFGAELLYRLYAMLWHKPLAHPNALEARVPGDMFYLPGFSLPRAQFLTTLFLLVNGLFCAILCTSVIPSIDSTTNGVYVAACCVPIGLNMVVVAPNLISNFAIVLGVWKIDGRVLAKTIDHFVHVAKLKHQLHQDIHQTNMQDDDLGRLMADNSDGYVDMHTIHALAVSWGASLTRHELNTLLYMECHCSRGRILVADVVALCQPPNGTVSIRVDASIKESPRGHAAYQRVASPH
ncbi:hypothetical protein DYB30_010611 [Aphanomyces astaci]|uniref:EF-hand domain-containing protein n=1 Tax=Aphanomyces astaci TaxID=112090 RepID=A0A397E8J8_APHAT|nr:hypothetical protein DYB38_010361 [Aphanomyces astaci]RHY61335.1 hypothetical protein DYB34_010602 [Aphanomyces astaci]RHY75554.1 hypothetical protein DYB30_010611 [Aphanomyces astaci]RHY92327.1 hypothetical protein DYB26_008394 [Aphanomyces astaci]